MITKVTAKALRVRDALAKYRGRRANYREIAADLGTTYQAVRKYTSVLVIDGLVRKTGTMRFELVDPSRAVPRGMAVPEPRTVVRMPPQPPQPPRPLAVLPPSGFIAPLSRERLMGKR